MADEEQTEGAEKSADFLKSWPAWFYGPDGQRQVFKHPDEVPEGWTDSPHKVGEAPEKPSDGPTALERLTQRFGEKTKKEIKEALTELGVEFDGRSSAEDLAALLLEKLPDDDSSNDN